MDENKLPALNTIDDAKRMVADKDYLGARAKLLELQCQYPSLSNIAPMITACDILCAAEMTFPNGETDLYWVLQVGPAATFSQISKQHKKLTASLEGIKDDFPGAVAALELVHDAFLVLSNIPKRLVFDSKRVTSWGDSYSSMSSADNPGYYSEKSLIQQQDSSLLCASGRLDKSVIELDESDDQLREMKTVIELDGSDDQLEDNIILDSDEVSDEAKHLDQPNQGVGSSEAKSILSPWKSNPDNEGQGFDDSRLSPKDIDLSTEKSTPVPESAQNQMSYEGFYNFDGIRKPEVFAVGQIWAAYDDENFPRRYAVINGISKLPFRLLVKWLRPVPQGEHEGKWCEVGLPVVCGLFNLHEGEPTLVEHTIFSHLVSYTASPTNDQFMVYPRENEVWAIYRDWKPFAWCHNPEFRRGCTLEIVQIIEGYPKHEGVIVATLVHIDGSRNIYKRDNKDDEESCFEIPVKCIYRFSHRLPAYGFQGGEMKGVSFGMFELDLSAIGASCSNSSASLMDSRGNSLKVEWTAEDFASGKVWAIYDGFDQMPRRYAVVNTVVSNEVVSVTLLEPHPISLEEISWVEENLPLSCGTFKVGATVATLPMSKFSHWVDCEPSNKKIFYRIYPKKGEIWAMYRNWNSKWKQQDFNSYSCQIVEIQSDISEDSGVLTASLEEVPGYKTFYKRQTINGFELSRVVPKSEMLRFSHRVEAFKVPGIQTRGIQEGSWHLEPDALPSVIAS